MSSPSELALQLASELESEVARLKHDVNGAIVEAKLRRIEGGVNWADIGCSEVRIIVDTYDGALSLEAVVDEASPDADHFRGFLNARIKDLGWERAYVVTEW